MRVSVLTLLFFTLAVASFKGAGAQRRRRASPELGILDMDDAKFWRALVFDGSTSLSSIQLTDSPTVAEIVPTTAPSTKFPHEAPVDIVFPTIAPTMSTSTDVPTKSPTKSILPAPSFPPKSSPKPPMATPSSPEPTISLEPSISDVNAEEAPTDPPTVRDLTNLSYEPSGSKAPCKSKLYVHGQLCELSLITELLNFFSNDFKRRVRKTGPSHESDSFSNGHLSMNIRSIMISSKIHDFSKADVVVCPNCS